MFCSCPAVSRSIWVSTSTSSNRTRCFLPLRYACTALCSSTAFPRQAMRNAVNDNVSPVFANILTSPGHVDFDQEMHHGLALKCTQHDREQAPELRIRDYLVISVLFVSHYSISSHLLSPCACCSCRGDIQGVDGQTPPL